MKRLALIGSKDFAEQIQILAEETGEYKVVGYFDDFEKKGTIIRMLPVLGKIEDIETAYKKDEFDCIFLAAGYNNFVFRESVFNRVYGKVPFATIISSSAKIGKDVRIGEGVYIGGDSSIGDRTIIGNNVFMHGGTTISHDNEIGDHTYLSGRINTAGFCQIGKRCFVGICVIISDHVFIVDDVWIGLGCIVAKNIKEPGKYMSPSAKLYKIE
jgi:sugar O-acyltransferase (sialic acid O-acetyltransferase NeuD family)